MRAPFTALRVRDKEELGLLISTHEVDLTSSLRLTHSQTN